MAKGGRGLDRLVRCGVAAVSTLVLVVGGGAPVVAAVPQNEHVLLSSDGSVFSPALPGALFDGMGLLVPGEAVTSTLWIRNPAASPTELRVRARDLLVPTTTFGRSVTLSVVDSLSGYRRSTTLSALQRCDVLVPSQTVPPGGTMRLSFTFALSDLSGSDGQGEAAAMNLSVDARDASLGPFSAPCLDEHTDEADDNDDDVDATPPTGEPVANHQDGAAARAPAPDRSLAGTGTDIALPLVIGGGLVLGGALLARRRRERDPS